MRTNRKRTIWLAFAVAGILSVGFVVSGCDLLTGGPLSANAQAPAGTGSAGAAAPPPAFADAGMPVASVDDPSFAQTRRMAQGRSYSVRNDPFAMLPIERAYDAAQASERLLSESGGWTNHYVEPQPVPDERESIEPMPYRRVQGILIGNAVVAIIDMGDGGRPVEVRPGQKVGNTEWTCVSIDREQVVLRREKGRPREIIVRLESAPAGMQPQGGQNQPGGFPGGMPPFGPGGPGGMPPFGPGGPGGPPFGPGGPGGGGAAGSGGAG